MSIINYNMEKDKRKLNIIGDAKNLKEVQKILNDNFKGKHISNINFSVEVEYYNTYVRTEDRLFY